jgi:hypothetical protein
MTNNHNPISSPKIKELETEAEQVIVHTVKAAESEVRRWPALAALILIGGAFTILSDRLKFAPIWLLLPLIAGLAIPAIIARLQGRHRLNHWLLVAIGLVITIAEIGSITLLLITLPDKSIAAVSLLSDAAILWITNVFVFALWYWQLDGGGPYGRSFEAGRNYQQESELLFVQLSLKSERPDLANWRPKFTDYLFVAFNTSTAFSPTDTAVLSTRLKALTMLQSSLSLVTLATLAARAINIL